MDTVLPSVIRMSSIDILEHQTRHGLAFGATTSVLPAARQLDGYDAPGRPLRRASCRLALSTKQQPTAPSISNN
jgi:hypothetical protein